MSKRSTDKTDGETNGLVSEVRSQFMTVSSAFAEGPLLRADPKDLPLPVATAGFAVINTLCDIFNFRKKEYRDHLMEQAEKGGVKTDKGGFRLWVDNTELIKERRQEKLPDPDDLKDLLRKRSIPITEAFDEVKTYKLNASKVEFLISSGRLTQEEVDELRKVTHAFIQKPSEVIDQFLESMKMEASPKMIAAEADAKKNKRGG